MKGGQQEKLETYTYSKHVRISTYFFVFSYIIMIIWATIGVGIQSWEYPIGLRIVYLFVIIVFMLIGIVYIAGLLKYDAVDSKVIISKDGIMYRSKVAEFFIPWEKMHRIEVQKFSYISRQIPKPYIVFYTDYISQKKLRLYIKLVSNEFIFVHYEKEIWEFVDKVCGWSIMEHEGYLKRYQKRMECKQQRLWRRLLREEEKHNQ